MFLISLLDPKKLRKKRRLVFEPSDESIYLLVKHENHKFVAQATYSLYDTLSEFFTRLLNQEDTNGYWEQLPFRVIYVMEMRM